MPATGTYFYVEGCFHTSRLCVEDDDVGITCSDFNLGHIDSHLARPVDMGGELGGVPEGSKIFHPLGGKIAGLILLCANSPRLRPPPRRCCSSLIPSR